jgi:hypothetical protein
MKTMHFLFFVMLIAVVSCGDPFDESIEEVNEDLFNIDITMNKNAEPYSFIIGRLGIEDGVWIVKEAENALISEIAFDNDRNAIYTYQPQKEFQGNDSVTVDRCFSPGDATCFRTVRYNFKFTVE